MDIANAAKTRLIGCVTRVFDVAPQTTSNIFAGQSM